MQRLYPKTTDDWIHKLDALLVIPTLNQSRAMWIDQEETKQVLPQPLVLLLVLIVMIVAVHVLVSECLDSNVVSVFLPQYGGPHPAFLVVEL